jgi:hypothetical protein
MTRMRVVLGYFLIAMVYLALSARSEEPIVFIVPHGDSFEWTDDHTKGFKQEASLFEGYDASGIGFDVTYADSDVGFADPETGYLARDTFRQVLQYVAGTLDFQNRTVDIYVRPSQTDGGGFLAAAGTGFPLRPGIHPGGMLHRLITGEKSDDEVPEMVLTVEFGYPWAYADEPPDPDKFDLFTTLLHEVVHALGFSSSITYSGTSTYATGAYSVYDTFLVDRRSGEALISRNPLIPFFAGNVDTLTLNAVGFRGRHALNASGLGSAVPVYSGSPFRRGSSMSHWEFGILPDGVLMDPGDGPGEIRREFSPVDHGAILDLVEEARATERASAVGCAVAPYRPMGRLDELGDGLLTMVLIVGLLLVSRPRGHTSHARRDTCPTKQQFLN